MMLDGAPCARIYFCNSEVIGVRAEIVGETATANVFNLM